MPTSKKLKRFEVLQSGILKVQVHAFLTRALDRGKGIALRSDRFMSGGKLPVLIEEEAGWAESRSGCLPHPDIEPQLRWPAHSEVLLAELPWFCGCSCCSASRCGW